MDLSLSPPVNCTLFFRLSAYDIDETIKHFNIKPSDISLVSIATAIHWLDTHKFLTNLVNSIHSDTIVAVIGYIIPDIMNQSLMDEKRREAAKNSSIEIITENKREQPYDQKFERYEKIFKQTKMEQYSVLEQFENYIQFNLTHITSKFWSIPFENYFKHREYREYLVVKEMSLHELVEFMRSTSFYQAFRKDNAKEIEKGLVEDPIILFASQILIEEKLLEKNMKIDFESKIYIETMRSIRFDVMWTFFIHILNYWLFILELNFIEQ